METPFNITKEEVLELAATKVSQEHSDYDELDALVKNKIEERINELLSDSLKKKVDESLSAEMHELLSKEIVPVDIWGEKCGNPTTIRQQLHERARAFWNVRVDSEGRETLYGGTTRHEQLMKKILADEFAQAVKDNATVIVAEFKKAILNDAVKITTEHINRLIK